MKWVDEYCSWKSEGAGSDTEGETPPQSPHEDREARAAVCFRHDGPTSLCLGFSQPDWTKRKVPNPGVTQWWVGRCFVTRPQGAAKQHQLWKRVPSRFGLGLWSTKVLPFFSSNSRAVPSGSYWHPQAPETPKGFRRQLICREILSQLQIYEANPAFLERNLFTLNASDNASAAIGKKSNCLKVLRHHQFLYNQNCSKNCGWI